MRSGAVRVGECVREHPSLMPLPRWIRNHSLAATASQPVPQLAASARLHLLPPCCSRDATHITTGCAQVPRLAPAGAFGGHGWGWQRQRQQQY